jgi:predicted nucleic acid-binding protein
MNITLSLDEKLVKEVRKIAEQAGCTKIWSEDLNAGQVYFGIKVENPFA